MSFLKICSVLVAFTLTGNSNAQLLSSVKTSTNNNPLCVYNLIADPTAVEYNGRLYVYGTNDQQEFDVANGANNTYGKIQQLVCISTADMVNWTFHGTINVKSVCPWIWTSWAPSIASRLESDGKTHFYMYFTNSASGIGVMTSTSPVGPWKDPLGKALIDGRTPGLGTMSNIIDPGVVIDEDGTGWLTFGGGDVNKDGSKLLPGNARIVKLGANMISLSGSVKKIPAPYHFEANELNKNGEYFVFSYSTNWDGDKSPWATYKGRGSYPAPSTCSIVQMRTKTPLDESSWEYKGEILKNPGNFGYPWGNNHTHCQTFEGVNYLIYHTQWLETKLKKGSGYRSLAINKISVSSTNGIYGSATINDKGISQITAKCPNAYELNQAECTANSAGVSAKNYGNGGNTVVVPKDGAWTMIRNLKFEEQSPKSITLTAKGTGTIEVHVGSLTSKAIAIADVNALSMRAITVDIDDSVSPASSLVDRSVDVYFVFKSVQNMTFDSWKFNKLSSEQLVGVANVEADSNNASDIIYNMSGQRLSNPQKGLNIINGKKVVNW